MSKYIGDVSAYAYAVSKGYTGTEEEFAELMADYADVGQRAEDAAESALDSKTAAQTAAQTATTKASEASTSATSASGSASAASASASQASGSATNAANSATAASGSATSAAGSATTASTKANEASASATAAQTAQTAAEAAQTAAEAAQGKAEDAKGEAETTAQSIAASAAQIATNAAGIAQLKSEVSALPTDGVVANSKQLLSENGTDNTEPYTFRAVPVNADRAELDAVVGGTVAWNQLYNPSIIESLTINGITFTKNEDGSISVSGTATADCTFQLVGTLQVVANHKMLIKGCPSGGTYNTYNISTSGYSEYGNGLIVNNASNTRYVWIRIENGMTTTTPIVFKPQLFDLTAMFGSTIADYIYSLEQSTAGAGVAWFRKLFPKDYYPYDAGTLKSVEGVSSHDMVGFNQWDEEWEQGGIVDGNPSTDASRVRSKNYCKCVASTSYYRHCGKGAGINIFWYDADKNYISYSAGTSTAPVTSPANAHYFKICTTTTYGGIYLNDICINLSDPTKNGTYEPYVKHSYPLDSTLTLRGIPKLDANNNLYYDGDRYLPDGTVERRYNYLEFDGSSDESWSLQSINSSGIANFNILIPAYNTNGINAANNVSNRFKLQTSLISVTTTEGYMFSSFTTLFVRIDSTKANTVAAFRTWLASNPTTLVYMLATPTTETADPYQSLQVCDPNGTEEYVTTGIVPVGHETRYPENLRAKIEGLPWDFSSLIAPTEKTTTASRNYTTGSLLIMNNVLYKVTANIANGGTITPDTNVTATTLSEVISALQ